MTTAGECRYRLDNSTSARLALPDGRTLGYAQYGIPNGSAILYCHGLPGSRIEAAALEKNAIKYGARVIAVDRPGYGWSSPQPNRVIRDSVKDLEYLTEHLELDAYAVMGISGGGPYALACATYLPADKLKVVSIVCGLGPPDIGTWGMNWGNWLGFTFGFPYLPSLVYLWFKGEPGAQLQLSDEERLERQLQHIERTKSTADPKDISFFGDVDRMKLYLRTARESYGQGFDALAQDGHLSSVDFGFRVEDIRPDLPFQLWYGKRDTSVPLNHGQQIAARLGPRATLRIEDETHASIYANWEEQIVKNLVNAM